MQLTKIFFVSFAAIWLASLVPVVESAVPFFLAGGKAVGGIFARRAAKRAAKKATREAGKKAAEAAAKKAKEKAARELAEKAAKK